MGGNKVNTNFDKKESLLASIIEFAGKGKSILSLVATVVVIGLIACGCGLMGAKQEEAPVVEAPQPPMPKKEVSVPAENVDLDTNKASNLVSYDVTSIGRADPFMPIDEINAFEEARRSALEDARLHNESIQKIKDMQNISVRELDDISPYSFNLPVPPTSLASASSAAAKITRTKVVGIMYNKVSPSAIINVDDKDYLVRIGDKIIGQEYKVVQINPSIITVSLGSNIYSASIGELFSRDDFDRTQNDLYNLKNRFGGRKS